MHFTLPCPQTTTPTFSVTFLLLLQDAKLDKRQQENTHTHTYTHKSISKKQLQQQQQQQQQQPRHTNTNPALLHLAISKVFIRHLPSSTTTSSTTTITTVKQKLYTRVTSLVLLLKKSK
jgi:signal-transduction protein with cAMP-binding, CBS, and nucleotidyltransferase domain